MSLLSSTSFILIHWVERIILGISQEMNRSNYHRERAETEIKITKQKGL